MTTIHQSPPDPPLSRTATLVLIAIGTEERHGYAIMQEVARITDGATRLGPGGVYTTIKRLVDDGLIEETVGRAGAPGPEDLRRRYYRLTTLGRAMASAEVRRLDALVQSARPWALESSG